MNTTALAKACLATATALQQLAAALEAEPAELGTPARPASLEPPASVAEPECGCSRYTRCDRHEAARSKACRCNGPDFPSSACNIEHHRRVALSWPDRDPALVD